MKVGGYVLEPYSQTPLLITLRNVTSSPANATTTKQSWSCTYKGLDKSQSCACSNTLKSIPPNLLTTNDSVVVAEVSYGYKPLIFDFFMQRAAGGSESKAGASTLTETIYLKPRSQAAMLMQENKYPLPDADILSAAAPSSGPLWRCQRPATGPLSRKDSSGCGGTIPGCICPSRPFPPMLVRPAVRQAARQG